ncbi:MAG TPA: 4-hydroxythreonine-4-phosphate dehydrogenase PdxA [Pirellulales bacterium]
MDRPRIAITLGDPTGIGPEIVVRAWSDPAVHAFCRPMVVGHPEIVRRAATLLDQPARVLPISKPAEAKPTPTDIPCISVGNDEVLRAPPGQVDARGGQAAYEALVAATKLALGGEVDAITTGPLHKAALWQAGHHYPGHTELLAELCGVDNYAMMLYLAPGAEVRGKSGLAVVHVTLHMALRDAIAALDSEGILRKSRLVSRFMAQFTSAPPRVGVCALNPHAGEDGLFGDEERTIIRPAVELGVKEGLNLEGPLPADTLLARARDGQFDAVVAMVHDQGHIAIKLLAMHRAVNVTLGLPIVRTSVAHGTAFDLAWQGRAEAAGMIEALRVASRLATGTLRDSRAVETAAP